ncbi:MAG TPA: efflux RND transporter periplasmic adaptor subunit, partial [Candidatus Eisenbacteria bacterium]
GQVLCRIEPSSFRARVVQAEAAVAKAEAAVKDAQRVLNRARELVRENYISQAEVEAAEVALEQRQAELQQARAQLEISQVDLANTTIRAPIDGVVIARSIDLGQTVAASLQAPKLFVIANDLSRMQVETRIDEADIGRIRPGLPVTFTVDAFPDDDFEGRVAQVRLEPIVDQGVVTYTTVIHTDNPDLKLRPGMTANVSVRVARRDQVLKVPSAALRFRPPAGPRGGGRGALATGPTGGDRAAMRGAAFAERGGAPTSMGRGVSGSAVGPTPGAGASGSVVEPVPGGARGAWGSDHRPRAGGAPARRAGAGRGPQAVPGAMDDDLKPGSIFVLRDGRPERISVMTGLTDGAFVEVHNPQLKPGDQVVVGLDVSLKGPNLQPPPGMGGPQFGGGRPAGTGGGRR